MDMSQFRAILDRVDDVYEFRLPGRRLSVWMGSAVMAFLLIVALVNSAPWYIWVIWGGTSVGFAWLLLRNPVSGLRIDGKTLTLSPWRKPVEIALSEIDHVEIIDWSESTDVVIHLTDGERLTTFSGDIPPTSLFEMELKKRDIPVHRH